MNRQEPYIGMPIILGDFDDSMVQTQQMHRQQAQMQADRREQMQHQQQAQMQADRREQMQQSQQMQHQQQAQMQADRREQMQHQQNAGQAMQPRQPMVLAMAYVPWQRWNEVYPYDEGLNAGTIFPELHLPFEGYRWGGKRK